MKYEIEIENGLIPEGWEAIAYRVPRDSDHAVLLPNRGFNAEEAKLILRRKFDMEALKEQLRTVFKAGTWFARDGSDSKWSMYEKEPSINGSSFWAGQSCQSCEKLNVEFPDVPWRESKFQI